MRLGGLDHGAVAKQVEIFWRNWKMLLGRPIQSEKTCSDYPFQHEAGEWLYGLYMQHALLQVIDACSHRG